VTRTLRIWSRSDDNIALGQGQKVGPKTSESPRKKLSGYFQFLFSKPGMVNLSFFTHDFIDEFSGPEGETKRGEKLHVCHGHRIP